MFKKLSELLGWFYLRSISKKEDWEIFWLTRYDKENNRFITPYHWLPGKQIDAVLKIIDREIVKSYQFGLKISREHMLKEKAVALAILDKMGYPGTVPERFKFEQARKMFSEAMSEIMKEELAFYFEKLGEEGRVRNMYNCHLESVRSAILHAVYHKELPYT